MKKIYTSILFLLVTPTVFAQLQFTANNCFQLNDSSKLGFAVLAQGFDNFVSQTGNNYTWDFTDTGTPGPWTNWTNPTISYNFQPSSQSIHTPFAASQINEYSIVAFPRDHFFTYSANQDTLYANGYYKTSNIVYIPQVPYLTFPLSFSDSVFHYQSITMGVNGPPASVSRYWIYDGFGTVKLPYGTENNVFRIRTKQIDSLTSINYAIINEEIIWFRQDGIPLLRFEKQGTNSIYVYYASMQGTNSINENSLKSSISIFPNPFTDIISFSNVPNENIKQVLLYDSQGVLMFSEYGKPLSINTANLNKGIYIIEILLSDNSVIHRKLIK